MVIDMPAAPLPRGSYGTFGYSDEEIEREAIRLQVAIKQPCDGASKSAGR